MIRRANLHFPQAVVNVLRGLLGMEISHKRRRRLQAVAAQLLLGIAGMALITSVCFWLGFGLARTGFAYVILVALVSLLGSFSASVVLSIVAAACLNYFFAAPLFEFRIDLPDDIERIAVFLATAVVVTALTTRRKRAEEALAENRARLEEAQRLAHVGWWERDLITDRVTVSDEVVRILGARPVGRWLNLIHPEDRSRAAKAAETAVRGGPRYDVEYRVLRPDGALRVVHSQGDLTRDASGRPCSSFGTIQDITERKRAEEALREVQMELTHANRVTTMGQLTASVAHEVNQPIAAAVTNAQAALRWLGAQPPNLEEVRQALGRIIKNGGRAGDVIGRIRALIKKAPPRKDRFDLNEAARDVIALTQSEVLKHGISLQTQLAAGLPAVDGDRIQLQQVILNLILNAVEAMSDIEAGGRELRISTETDAAGGVLVTVRDTGPGLDPTGVNRLFEAFYTTKPGGMGMGLSISRSIIEAHGGRLWACANEPCGAVFQFTLPRETAETVPAEHVGPMPVV